MNRNLSYAFTLIEILIVLFLVIFLSSLIGPRLLRRKPQDKIPAVLYEINNLVTFARQQAISDQKKYRIFFNSPRGASDFAEFQTEVEDPDNKGQKKWEKFFSEYFDTKYVFPENIKMVAIYGDKKELLESNKGKFYCYIIPNGLFEDIMIHIVRKVDDMELKSTFKAFPFEGRFEMYEGFIRPGAEPDDY